MRCVSSLHCQKVYWVYISLSVWMHVYRYSVNASTPMNYIFTEFYTISRFYVTLYLLSYCVFRFSWCRAYIYICVCIYVYIYVYICMYVYVCICICVHVYMYIYACECMLLCIHDYMYVFYVCSFYVYWFYDVFFTYGCLVRDDLIKKFKQTNKNKLIISMVQWHSYEGSFTRDASAIDH